MPTATGGSQLPSQAPSSERPERKRKRKRRRRRSVKAGEETSTEAAALVTRISEDEAEKKRKAEDEDEEVVSSAPSSPLREPCFTDDNLDPTPELIEAWNRATRDYDRKRERYKDLVTIHCRNSHMLFNPELLPVAEPATKAVLSAARFVVGLSSSFDGQQLRKRCSGFWVDWNEENKTGIVLTTTHLISSKGCSVEQKGEGVEEEYAPHGKVKYYPHAKVTVHLLDGSAAVGHLIYYQEQYDLAFFRVRVDQYVQLPSFNDGVKWGQLVFWLGRDANFDLTMKHLRPGYMNPNTYEFACIPRPQLGLAFSGIKLLDFVQVEKIWRKYKIDDGLIVNEVLKGSQAEQNGIRRGDIIESFNGECIFNTVQLENLLLSLCKSAGKGCDSKIYVSVEVFHVRKRCRKTREFTVGVSEHLEATERF